MASEAFWQLRKRHCLLSTKAISIFLFKLKRGKKIYLHTRHEQVCDVFVTLACSRRSEIVGSGVKSKAARKNENTIWTPGIGYRHIALSSLVILKRSVQSLKTVNPRPPNRKKKLQFFKHRLLRLSEVQSLTNSHRVWVACAWTWQRAWRNRILTVGSNLHNLRAHALKVT